MPSSILWQSVKYRICLVCMSNCPLMTQNVTFNPISTVDALVFKLCSVKEKFKTHCFLPHSIRCRSRTFESSRQFGHRGPRWSPLLRKGGKETRIQSSTWRPCCWGRSCSSIYKFVDPVRWYWEHWEASRHWCPLYQISILMLQITSCVRVCVWPSEWPCKEGKGSCSSGNSATRRHATHVCEQNESRSGVTFECQLIGGESDNFTVRVSSGKISKLLYMFTWCKKHLNEILEVVWILFCLIFPVGWELFRMDLRQFRPDILTIRLLLEVAVSLSLLILFGNLSLPWWSQAVFASFLLITS